MQATVASDHQKRIFIYWGRFAIDLLIRSGTAPLGNDFVPPVAGRSRQPFRFSKAAWSTSLCPFLIVLVLVVVLVLGFLMR
jgi:hypothetical protein